MVISGTSFSIAAPGGKYPLSTEADGARWDTRSLRPHTLGHLFSSAVITVLSVPMVSIMPLRMPSHRALRLSGSRMGGQHLAIGADVAFCIQAQVGRGGLHIQARMLQAAQGLIASLVELWTT